MTDSTVAGTDYRDTRTAGLTERPFPVPIPGEFRVHFEEGAYDAMMEHATSSVDVELAGVLVGDVHYDGAGPHLNVAGAIRAEQAEHRNTQVTFTHQSWNHINKTKDAEFPESRVLGWYHTHPGFGIFLSEMDVFIHQNFFNEPFQIAVVIDPKSKQQGCFVWSNGAPHAQPRYWRGSEEVALVSDDARLPSPATAGGNQGAAQENRRGRGDGPWGLALGVLGLLVVSYLLYGIFSVVQRTERTLGARLGQLSEQQAESLEQTAALLQGVETGEREALERHEALLGRLDDFAADRELELGRVRQEFSDLFDALDGRIESAAEERRAAEADVLDRIEASDAGLEIRLDRLGEDVSGRLGSLEERLTQQFDGIRAAQRGQDERIASLQALEAERLYEEVTRALNVRAEDGANGSAAARESIAVRFRRLHEIAPKLALEIWEEHEALRAIVPERPAL